MFVLCECGCKGVTVEKIRHTEVIVLIDCKMDENNGVEAFYRECRTIKRELTEAEIEDVINKMSLIVQKGHKFNKIKKLLG